LEQVEAKPPPEHVQVILLVTTQSPFCAMRDTEPVEPDILQLLHPASIALLAEMITGNIHLGAIPVLNNLLNIRLFSRNISKIPARNIADRIITHHSFS
jgi:hypothetical protein